MIQAARSETCRARGSHDFRIAHLRGQLRRRHNVAYVSRGLAYHGKKDYDRAIADYNQAIQLDPKDADAYFSRGLAKRRKGDNSGGDADIAAAKTIDPDVGN